MEKEFEYIIKELRNIKLGEDERAEMRAQTLAHVTIPKPSRLYYHYQIFKNYNFMLNKNKFVSALIIILVVVGTGGVSAFAEKAVPGDLLYGVKVSINEPVAGVFALTKEEKTEWQERLIERRLEEAQKLVSKDNLDEATRISLENRIQTKLDEFSTNVNELALQKNESINSSDLNIRLQASLAAHQNVLEKLKGETSTGENTKQETGKLLSSLEGFQNKVKGDHKNLELNVGVDSQSSLDNNDSSSATRKQDAALNLLNSVKLLYQKEKINLSVNIQSQIDSNLASAETALGDGKTLLSSSDFAGAIAKFQLVISSANDAKLLMLSNVIKGDIEDSSGVDGEDSNDIENNDGLNQDDNKNNIDSSVSGSIKIGSDDGSGSDNSNSGGHDGGGERD